MRTKSILIRRPVDPLEDQISVRLSCKRGLGDKRRPIKPSLIDRVKMMLGRFTDANPR